MIFDNNISHDSNHGLLVLCSFILGVVGLISFEVVDHLISLVLHSFQMVSIVLSIYASVKFLTKKKDSGS